MIHVRLEPAGAENSCLIKLTRGKFAIVDKPVPAKVLEYKWRAIKWHNHWYAVSTMRLGVKCRLVSMHRLIAETPQGQTCHHFHNAGLDNRRANLLNLTFREHKELHGIRKF